MKTRILIADDHEMVRAGLISMLEKQKDLEIVGEAADGIAAVQAADEFSPDIVIMDITMPLLNGVEATRQIVTAHRAIRVIALSIHYDRIIVAEILKAGASGYLLKNSAADELGLAIRAVRRGETCLSSKVTQIVVSNYIRGQDGPKSNAFSALT